MTVGNIVALIGALVGVCGLITTLIKTRSNSMSQQGTIKQQLDQRIDDRVAVQLKTAWDRIDKLEERSQTQDYIVDTLGSGFDALSGVIERVEPVPHILRWEAEAIRKAKEVRADDSLWPTLTRRPPTPA